MLNIGRIRFGWLLGIVMSGAIGVSANCAFCTLCSSEAIAQITPDGTLPSHSNVTINGSVINITGGTQAGRNLFHSFQQFSVPTGGTAIFNNGLDIQNIISRVTGTSRSMIDGLIKTSGTANLFFLNPNGIVFGPHASLRVGGSFVATTANAIQFGFQGSFSASAPNNPALLTVDPSALLFNQIAASPIQNNSMAPVGTNPSGYSAMGLSVPDGKSLLLVGGDINLEGGNLNAFGGHVELGGLAGSGTLGLNVDGNTISLSFPDGVERASVYLKNSSNVDVSGGGSGSIAVNARNLDLQQSSLTADIRSSSDTPSLRAGDITVNATEAIRLGQSSQIESNNAVSNAKVMPHNINITTGSLSMMNASEVNVFTSGQGNAGTVNINARDNLSFDGSGSGIVSITQQQSTGNAGNININTGTLSLTNGAGVFAVSNGQGKAGSVTINARDFVSLLNGVNIETTASPNSIGNNGGISITTGTLSVTNTNGTGLNTSTSGMGNAGDVTINARDLVTFNNGRIITSANGGATGKSGDISITSGDISLANGSLIILATAGSGNAGNALLTTRSLSLTDGSLLLAGSFANSPGNGGAIQIKATESVSLSGSYPIENRRSTEISTDTTERATGNGGNITIDTNAFRLSDGAIVNARTTSNGNAGNITINSKTFEAINGGELISTTTGSASAGNIQVHATNWVSVNGSDPTFNERRNIFNNTFDTAGFNVEANSGFFVRSSSSGRAGNIEVNAPQIRLDNSGTFSADSTSGNGGNTNLQASNILLLRHNSLISNTSGTALTDGNGGNFTLNTKFLVAPAFENNDILTNAFNGRGGNININAFSIFGFVIRSRKDLEKLRPNDLDPRQLTTNDISAVSQTGPSFVILNQEDFSRVSVLPTTVDVSNRLITPSCTAFTDSGGSSFTVTGRGGLPPSPDEPLTSDAVWLDTRLPVATVQHQYKTHASKPKPKPIAIVPATGWVFNAKGEVTLISSAHSATSLGFTPSCLMP